MRVRVLIAIRSDGVWEAFGQGHVNTPEETVSAGALDPMLVRRAEAWLNGEDGGLTWVEAAVPTASTGRTVYIQLPETAPHPNGFGNP
jgi:hypothetical protein